LRKRFNLRLLVCTTGALFACASFGAAQDLGPQNGELSVSGGTTWFKSKKDVENTTLLRGGFINIKGTVNPFEHFGFELGGTVYGNNPLRLTPTINGLPSNTQLGSRLFQGSGDALIYGTNKSARFRPFVFAGIGFNSYRPTDDARQLVRSPSAALFQAGDLKSDTRAVFNYGGGFKVRLTTHFGIRADLRGMASGLPHFGLPSTGVSPALYIPNSHLIAGLQLSSGISYIFSPGPTVVEEIKVVEKTTITTTIATTSGNTSGLCAGDTVSFHASATGGRDLMYRWMVDGTNAGTGADFTYTASKDGGSHTIGLEAALGAPDANVTIASAAPVTVTVNAYSNPTLTVTADKSTLMFGESTPLSTSVTKGSCNGNITLSCTATEGTITGTDSKVFDSNGVTFDMSNRSREQSKQVTVSCTATDDKGGSGTASAPLTISLKAGAQRKYDVLFPSASARVNNCGKRALIDEIAPALEADPGMTVVLIGHVDGKEKAPVMRRRRNAPAAEPIDQERAENIAAILSAATGICRRVNANQIKVKWIGSDQAGEYRTPNCADSVKERRGAATTGDAKDRRVEVYLVPTGADMPPAAQGAMDLPAGVKALGCPK
jgi:outer membrane protein OmpA-like peptidoglycan-associated protein